MSDENNTQLSLPLVDVTATENLGGLLGEHLTNGLLVFLQGDLGAGKTSLVRGLLRRLGYTGAVKSPTYTLLEEYLLGKHEIIHFDLYRLADPEELDLIGIRDYFAGDACCFIEWPERGEGYLAQEDLHIHIDHRGAGRMARLQAGSEAGKKLLTAIRTALGPECD